MILSDTNELVASCDYCFPIACCNDCAKFTSNISAKVLSLREAIKLPLPRNSSNSFKKFRVGSSANKIYGIPADVINQQKITTDVTFSIVGPFAL